MVGRAKYFWGTLLLGELTLNEQLNGMDIKDGELLLACRLLLYSDVCSAGLGVIGLVVK